MRRRRFGCQRNTATCAANISFDIGFKSLSTFRRTFQLDQQVVGYIGVALALCPDLGDLSRPTLCARHTHIHR
jgi:hypothetical protein